MRILVPMLFAMVLAVFALPQAHAYAVFSEDAAAAVGVADEHPVIEIAGKGGRPPTVKTMKPVQPKTSPHSKAITPNQQSKRPKNLPTVRSTTSANNAGGMQRKETGSRVFKEKGYNPPQGARVWPKNVPRNWTVRNSERKETGKKRRNGSMVVNPPGRGIIFQPKRTPGSKGSQENVRLMPGRANAKRETERNPYIRHQNPAGVFLKNDGNPGSSRSPQTHMPVKDFNYQNFIKRHENTSQ